MTLKKIKIALIFLIIFNILLFNVIEANTTINKPQNSTVILEESKLETSDELNLNILSASISGIFGLLGVFVGFIGLIINNKLAFNTTKKENTYNILMQKYNKLIEIKNKYYNQDGMCPFSMQDFVEDEITIEENFISIDKINKLLKDLQYFFELTREASQFIIDNKYLLKKFSKFNEQEFYNLRSSGYVKAHIQFEELLKHKNYNKDILYNVAKEVSKKNSQVDDLLLKIKQNMEKVLF